MRKCLTRCRHCQILFFTHPRNAGRNDLGCPFGCRDVHRRQNAIRRSTEYYRSKEGKIKKRRLNAARSEPKRISEHVQNEKRYDDEVSHQVDITTIGHLQLVTSLVESRWVGLEEIFSMLDKILRQHSIDPTEKLTYAAFCHQINPP